jgi:uncharacterized damage-inducible protein DinB
MEMNIDALRHFYAYHFAENRQIWDSYIVPLANEQFRQNMAYSQGSVRDQIVHLMGVDDAWFGDLAGVRSQVDPADLTDRATIRAQWDIIEQNMRDYLATVQDDMLATKPLSGEDEDLLLWQVLLHVVNHGTDHRAQLLRVLNDLGVETASQDYIFYVYANPL